MAVVNDFEDLQLLKASPKDLEEVHSMWVEAAIWMKSKGIDQWLDDQVTLETVEYCYANSDLFIVKSNQHTVGTFFLIESDPQLWEDEGEGRCGYLHRLVVKREFAGCGLGFKLLDLAERHLKNNGKTVFRLDCKADSPKLNEFYHKAGFTYRGRKDGEGWSASLYERPVADR